MFVNINSKYDIIITMSPICEITGHIFECFDYYLFLRNYFNVGILFFDGIQYNKLKELFNYKYNIDFSNIENDIILYKIKNTNALKIFIFNQHTKVLLVDGNLAALEYYRITFMTNHLYGFLCAPQEISTNNIQNKKIIYLQDYRIYGKSFQSIDYVKKLPFKYYKSLYREKQNIGLIYMTYMCRKITPDTIEKYHKLSGCSQTILVVPYKLPEYDTIPCIKQHVAPIKNLFEKFDTYIYTPVQRKLDCSSRMITECFFYGKNVFKQIDYYDIALEIRYSDCINNLDKLDLKSGDIILDILS